MSRQLEDAVDGLVNLLSRPLTSSKHRWIVALAGIPASGKTTLANVLCDKANQKIQEQCNTTTKVVQVVPMDGYHLPRSELDKMPNREEAYERRGAYWTFDVDALCTTIDKILSDKEDVTVHAWGHEIKDPSYDAITVSADTRIVILEGLYVMLEKDDWGQKVACKSDLRILLQCPPEVTLERGPKRNFEAGISPSLEASVARWKANDLVNGELLLEYMNHEKVDYVIDAENVFISQDK